MAEDSDDDGRGAEKSVAAGRAPRLGATARRIVRAVHRDSGYLAVGLTIVYAASGLAVNHVADWDPSFVSYEHTHELGPFEGDADAIAHRALERLAIRDTPTDVYESEPGHVEIALGERTLHVDASTGRVVEEGREDRWFLRAANWLHLNRGKKAWTYVADLYAGGLLLLAATGVFMLPGRKGLIGRRGFLILLGAAVPVLYVTLSGGP